MFKITKTLQYIWICIIAIALFMSIYKIVMGDYYSSGYFFVIVIVSALMYLSTAKRNKKLNGFSKLEKRNG